MQINGYHKMKELDSYEELDIIWWMQYDVGFAYSHVK